MRKLIREQLKSFSAYHVLNQENMIKLDANESPYSLDEKVKNDLVNWINQNENFNIYPDTDSLLLRSKIADFWKVNIDNIICGVGSDQLIDGIMKLFLEPGDKVLIPTPSFSMYKLTTVLNHGEPIEFNLNEDFSFDYKLIIEKYKETKPKLLFLCTPNNPTGNIIEEKHIVNILEAVDCPVIVDEAYGEFSYTSMVKYVNSYKNLIVLRTFSKAYGLAGLRVGYGVANKEMIDYINITKPPYNLNTFSQKVAELVLQNSQEYEKRIDLIVKQRDYIYNKLEDIEGIDVFPSGANFFLIRSKSVDLAEKLKARKILVRSFKNDKDLKGCIRVSVGKEEENELLISSIKEIMRGN